jgi:hypothetical protein
VFGEEKKSVEGLIMDRFTGFISENVVELMVAHGKAYGVTVYENGCAGVP